MELILCAPRGATGPSMYVSSRYLNINCLSEFLNTRCKDRTISYLNPERTKHVMQHGAAARTTCLGSLVGSFCAVQAPLQQTTYASEAAHILPVK